MSSFLNDFNNNYWKYLAIIILVIIFYFVIIWSNCLIKLSNESIKFFNHKDISINMYSNIEQFNTKEDLLRIIKENKERIEKKKVKSIHDINKKKHLNSLEERRDKHLDKIKKFNKENSHILPNNYKISPHHNTYHEITKAMDSMYD